MAANYTGALPTHGRFHYRGINQRKRYRWPNGAGVAVYLGFNIEHFAFGEGLGAAIGPISPQPDVLNYSWREYGNRVGAWRCLELFDGLGMPSAALINTALYDHCPDLIAACVARGDELVGHGHSNAERQAALDEAGERALLQQCREQASRRCSLNSRACSFRVHAGIQQPAATPACELQSGQARGLSGRFGLSAAGLPSLAADLGERRSAEQAGRGVADARRCSGSVLAHLGQ